MSNSVATYRFMIYIYIYVYLRSTILFLSIWRTPCRSSEFGAFLSFICFQKLSTLLVIFLRRLKGISNVVFMQMPMNMQIWLKIYVNSLYITHYVHQTIIMQKMKREKKSISNSSLHCFSKILCSVCQHTYFIWRRTYELGPKYFRVKWLTAVRWNRWHIPK